MNGFAGTTLSWSLHSGVVELSLHHLPCNEIGSAMLGDLERFAEAVEGLGGEAGVLIMHSTLESGFSAGADLRELHRRLPELHAEERLAGVRDFIERIHRVFNTLDAAPMITIAAVHGVTFGGGFELALTADLIIADKMTRFCFPELRLGLIPGFGGIPRLKRDVGNSVVRDLLLTGRSINAERALASGLVSQVTAEGQALRAARATATQIMKFDGETARVAKRFIKPIPRDELAQEIHLFCELFARPAVAEGLRRFVESKDALPYLP